RLRQWAHVFPGLPFADDVLVKVLVALHIPHQALAFLTLSLKNWAVSLFSSWTLNRPKPALLKPKDVILFFASLLSSWDSDLYYLMVAAAMATPNLHTPYPFFLLHEKEVQEGLSPHQLFSHLCQEIVINAFQEIFPPTVSRTLSQCTILHNALKKSFAKESMPDE
ncbi:unnamed protein product, partial [Bubo scandiacus]